MQPTLKYFFICLLLLSACHAPRANFDLIVNDTRLHIGTRNFDLSVWSNTASASRREMDTLRIYLHGDGLPWLSKQQIALNPNPQYSLVWDLMQLDPEPAFFLSRPCYFLQGTPTVSGRNCHPDVWTHARYSRAVVESISEAVIILSQRFATRKIEILGYSGGGTLAFLVADNLATQAQLPLSEPTKGATRLTLSITTVAANLDIDAWARHNGFSRLNTSLNPANYSPQNFVQQVHLCGRHDTNIASTSQVFFTKQRQECEIVDATHDTGWLEHWPTLLNRQRVPLVK